MSRTANGDGDVLSTTTKAQANRDGIGAEVGDFEVFGTIACTKLPRRSGIVEINASLGIASGGATTVEAGWGRGIAGRGHGAVVNVHATCQQVGRTTGDEIHGGQAGATAGATFGDHPIADLSSRLASGFADLFLHVFLVTGYEKKGCCGQCHQGHKKELFHGHTFLRTIVAVHYVLYALIHAHVCGYNSSGSSTLVMVKNYGLPTYRYVLGS